MGLFVRLLICIFVACLTLYVYLDKSNDLTELRLSIPLLAREVKDIQEKNLELQYAIECFESPVHLLEIVQHPELGHLKYPTSEEIVYLPEPQDVS